MSDTKNTSASRVAWISAVVAVASLILAANGQWADMNRLGVDDAVTLSNTLTRIDGRLGRIEDLQERTAALAAKNDARLDGRNEFMNCTVREINRLDDQAKMNTLIEPRCTLKVSQ